MMLSALLVAAAATAPCTTDYQSLKQELAQKYQEAPVSAGLQSNGSLLQIFASTETGTWTALSTTPQGVTCILSSGKNWEGWPGTPAGPEA